MSNARAMALQKDPELLQQFGDQLRLEDYQNSNETSST